MIETRRLLLRPFTEDDLDIIYALYSDPEIMRYSPFDLMTFEQAKAHLEEIVGEWKKPVPANHEVAVLLKSDNTKIGRAHILVEEDETAMIGGHFLKAFWGNGFGKEMTRSLIDYGFSMLKLHRIYGLCNPGNTASRKMMEHCGMRQEAHFRQKCKYTKYGESHWEDEMVYAILREEWE